MYLQHFGLSAAPFQLTPDSAFLFMSEPHNRAKAYMDYTVWNREGFVVVTGEVGCGKTTLIQRLLSELDENVVVAKIFQTQLDEVEFLQAVLVEFGLNPFNAKKVELLDMLNTFLIEQFMQRKEIVLIVDDAHNLSVKVLEEIRMLAGLETRKEKILHVILVGQPQLSEILDGPEMEQLLQRVKLRYHIRPLNQDEQGDYIRFRLNIAGAKGRVIFPPETLPGIFKYVGGIPRLINTFCDTMLTCAYADNLQKITTDVIETAAKELQWLPYEERLERLRLRTSRGAAVEGGVSGMLQEQTRSLAAIAEQAANLGRIGPMLEAINKKLTAIEFVLRESAQKAGAVRPGPASDPRQRTG